LARMDAREDERKTRKGVDDSHTQPRGIEEGMESRQYVFNEKLVWKETVLGTNTERGLNGGKNDGSLLGSRKKYFYMIRVKDETARYWADGDPLIHGNKEY